MTLNAPKNVTFWIAVVIALIGLVGFLVPTLGIGAYSFWVVLIGFIILVLGNTVKGL